MQFSGVSEDGRVKESPASKRWNNQISAGFDALLGFASTELDKNKDIRRKSSETDPIVLPSSNHKGSGAVSTSKDTVSTTCTTRSESRDSGLGKDSESDPHSSRTPVNTPPVGASENGPVASPRGNGTSPRGSPRLASSPLPRSRSRSSSSESHASRRDGKQSPHHRSRSRSPHSRDNSTEHDKYSNYDRHFKKKFFGRSKVQEQSTPTKTPSQEGNGQAKYSHAKFRPKGKNWEKNMLHTAMNGQSPGGSQARPPSQPPPSTSPVSPGPNSRSIGSGKPVPASGRSSTDSTRPPSTSSVGVRSSPNISQSHVARASPHESSSRPNSAASTSSHSGRHSGDSTRDAPFPIGGNPYSRGHGDPSRPPSLPGAAIPGQIMGGATRFDLEAARMAGMFGSAGHPSFGIMGLGHHPGFPRPPGGMLPDAMRGPSLAEMMPRPSFGGEAQMFNPLARHGKGFPASK